MTDLATYTVTINGVTTTMQLTAEEAARYGDAATPADTGAATPQPDATSTAAKAATPQAKVKQPDGNK